MRAAMRQTWIVLAVGLLVVSAFLVIVLLLGPAL